VGFNDEEPEPEPVPVAADDASDSAAEEDEDEDTGGDADEPAPTGPDPAEVAARMEALAAAYTRFEKAYGKGGPDAKATLKAREEIAAIFVTLKLPLPLTDALVRKLRDAVNQV